MRSLSVVLGVSIAGLLFGGATGCGGEIRDNGGGLGGAGGDAGGTCTTADDCPAPDGECSEAACNGGTCETIGAPAGTPAGSPTDGDCKQQQCDGQGAVETVADDEDRPVDGDACTDDLCTDGEPSHPPAGEGTACGDGLTCDGAGFCTGCMEPAPCPGGGDDECATRTCDDGTCGLSFAPVLTAVTRQVAGDCHQNVCDGAGNVINLIFDDDLPDDGSDCTVGFCTGGVGSSTNLASGTNCTSAGGSFCDGDGACVECLDVGDCPGLDTECQTPECTAGACELAFTAPGFVLVAQTPGDCQQAQCGASGAITNVPLDTDLPIDGNACTEDVCTAGVISHPFEPVGTVCGPSPLVCNATGVCTGCSAPTDCPGVDDECQTRACNGGVCSFDFMPAGTPIAVQTLGDCEQDQCDGAGNVVTATVDADVPVDGQQCTGDICTAGVPSNPVLPQGTACTQSGGTICDADDCISPSFFILRVGDGSAALTPAATPGFIEQRAFDGTLITALNLPVGGASPFTFVGNSTSEGHLSRSVDRRFVTLAGYDAPVGFAGVGSTASATVNRLVGRVDALLAFDGSTRFNSGFSGDNVRGATSIDGSSFWVSGNGDTGTAGVWHIALGDVGGTHILNIPNTVRAVGIFDGQLYGDSNNAAFPNVFTIGSGTPTSAGQMAASLPGMPTTVGPSPSAFVFFDRNPLVTGIDTLYLADSRPTASGGGVQKWTFDGTTWTLLTTFTNGLTAGGRGLTAIATGANITLITTTFAPAANDIVRYVDDGSLNPVGTVIGTAPANTVYKGVALSPR